jgi:para-nitrobenzyl esterase
MLVDPKAPLRPAGAALAFVALLCLGACALRPGAVPDLIKAADGRPIEARTTAGLVRGVSAAQGEAFLGIPFAAPPVGALRFKPPEPPAPWPTARDATKPGAMCMQAALPGSGPQSEDCLTLNVYAPPGAHAGQSLPVMVWLYGGAFVTGYNVEYDPSRLAQRQDVITVAPNYRLGAFGFLAHPGLRGPGEGAYALLDQQAALRWVHDNIAAFGGDPGKVTLFGESAGAWSVCEQLTAPAAQGLFQRAIIQSGACASPESVLAQADAEAGGLAMAANLGCGDTATAAQCLRSLPAKTLLKAKPQRRGLLGLQSWAPMSGGDVLPQTPRQAFQAGQFAAIPVIDGTNHDEGRLFLVTNRFKGKLWNRASYEKIEWDFFGDRTPQVLAQYAAEADRSYADAYVDLLTDSTFACPALALNALLERRAPVYAYEFQDPRAIFLPPRPPFTGALKAYHSAELPYVLQTPWFIADPARFDGPQRALSDRMQAAWATFARTGQPGGDWPLDHGDGPVRLTPEARGLAADFAAAHHCAFWNALGY